MPYVTSAKEILYLVAEYTNAPTLWIDTETADYKSKKPRLSLIQVLDDAEDMSGDRVYLLDVLDQPDLVADFIEQIMLNPAIEKVFHNASFDLKLLGGKKAQNITCTLEMAKKIPYYILPLPNYQLKSLALELCNFNNINKEEQTSNWGKRPLSSEQIEYACLDCIYLAQVHLHLLELNEKINLDPKKEDLTSLSARYQQVQQQCQLVNSEFEHLQERVKKAMLAHNLSETSDFKLTAWERETTKVAFAELANLVQSQGINLDFPVTLTKKLKTDLGESIEQLSVETEKTKSWRLKSKTQEDDLEDE